MENINDIQVIINKWSNSFLRPFIQPSLMKNSKVSDIEYDEAKFIYAKFLYGEQRGTLRKIPFDGSYGNKIKDLQQESLWLYSLNDEQIPPGFVAKSYDSGMIRTGIITKCKNCRGQGNVTCKKCKGKIRWTVKRGDRYVEKICSCGNGKQICEDCTGYGEVENVILKKTVYKIFETKNTQYSGEVPLKKIDKVKGISIFEYTIDFPVDQLRKILSGGIDKSEFSNLSNAILDDIHYKINNELFDKNIDIRVIHDLINTLFASVPNPCVENVPMEKEVMPVRVMLRVENSPVYKVGYTFKEADFTLWMYGNEKRVWLRSAPLSFNYKIIVLSLLLLGIILLIVYFQAIIPLVE